MSMSRPNRGKIIFKVAKAVLWAIQQTEWFNWQDFIIANPEYKKLYPGRILTPMLQIGILEICNKKQNGFLLYRSLWLVKNRSDLEEKFGSLRKVLTKK